MSSTPPSSSSTSPPSSPSSNHNPFSVSKIKNFFEKKSTENHQQSIQQPKPKPKPKPPLPTKKPFNPINQIASFLSRPSSGPSKLSPQSSLDESKPFTCNDENKAQTCVDGASSSVNVKFVQQKLEKMRLFESTQPGPSDERPRRKTIELERSVSQTSDSLSNLRPRPIPRPRPRSSLVPRIGVNLIDSNQVQTNLDRSSLLINFDEPTASHSSRSSVLASLSRNTSTASSSYYSAISQTSDNELFTPSCQTLTESQVDYNLNNETSPTLINEINANCNELATNLSYDSFDTISEDDNDDSVSTTSGFNESLDRRHSFQSKSDNSLEHLLLDLNRKLDLILSRQQQAQPTEILSSDDLHQKSLSIYSKFRLVVDSQLMQDDDSAVDVDQDTEQSDMEQPDPFSSVDHYLINQTMVKPAPLDPSSSIRKPIQSHWKYFVLESSSVEPEQSALVESMSTDEVNLYESIFEIIHTERTYLTNLTQLKQFPTQNPVFFGRLSKYDQNIFFGKIAAIYSLNFSLYHEFVQAFGRSIFMSEIITILSNYLSVNGGARFRPYIDFVRGQDERSRLTQNEEKFSAAKFPNLFYLQGLLIAPMQRITRYPLLLVNVRDRLLKLQDESRSSSSSLNVQELLSLVEHCLQNAKKLTESCNHALKQESKLRELIEFKKNLSGNIDIELVSTKRYILKTIPVMVTRSLKMSHGSTSKNVLKQQKCSLVLFNDLLILAKHKNKKKHKYLDHCSWSELEYRKVSNSGSDDTSPAIGQAYDNYARQLAGGAPYHMGMTMPLPLPAVPIYQSGIITLTKTNQTQVFYSLAFAPCELEATFSQMVTKLKQANPNID